jgi:hypothetical protein
VCSVAETHAFCISLEQVYPRWNLRVPAAGQFPHDLPLANWHVGAAKIQRMTWKNSSYIGNLKSKQLNFI